MKFAVSRFKEMEKITSASKSWQSSVTLEPVIFAFVFSNFVANGAQQNTNLLLRKVCTDKIGYNSSICLDHQSHSLIHLEVLKETNRYSLYLDLVGILPAVFYVIIGGALSDKHGKRKPLILLPLIGGLIANIAYVLISLFEEAVPLEVFFLTKMWEICGGMPLYYLGVCSYVASTSSKANRSSSLARMDGVEQIALIFGVSLSPLAFLKWGYVGCFIFRVFGGCCAIFYLWFLTPEVPQRKVSDSSLLSFKAADKKCQEIGLLKQYIVSPCVSAIDILRNPSEPSTQRHLIHIQLVNCTIYWFIMEEQNMLYFYMSRHFSSFSGADFAVYIIVIKVAGIFGLLIVIPFLSKILKLHESAMLILVTSLTATSLLTSAFVDRLFPYFYLTRLIGFLRPSIMSLARSLLAQSVNGVNEIGRIFAVTSFLSALLPFISNPSYRFLFDSTAVSFPEAILVMAGCLLTVSVILNIYLYICRNKILGGI